MSIYIHSGPFVPRTGVELFQERIEQQLAWEDKFYGSERCDFGEADEAAARAVLRDGGMGEIDLGGIMAQADRDLQREGDG